MRLMLIVVTVAVAMLLDLRVSQATQMPWCAGTTKGDFFSPEAQFSFKESERRFCPDAARPGAS